MMDHDFGEPTYFETELEKLKEQTILDECIAWLDTEEKSHTERSERCDEASNKIGMQYHQGQATMAFRTIQFIKSKLA